jgi:hypothetical protein
MAHEQPLRWGGPEHVKAGIANPRRLISDLASPLSSYGYMVESIHFFPVDVL